MSEARANQITVILGIGLVMSLVLLAAGGIGLYLALRQNALLRQELARTQAECAEATREIEARGGLPGDPFPALGPEAVVAIQVPEEGVGAAPVVPTDGGVFALDAAEWAVLLADSSALAREARYVPHKDPDGVADGFRVAAIRRDSLLARLGFKNGDVVRSVNGRALIDAAAALEAWEAARSETRFAFDLVRRGVPTTLLIEVR